MSTEPRDKGHLIKNSVRFAPGLDIRTNGGQFIVEPSLHASGGQYEWPADINDTPIAEMPEWLVQTIISDVRQNPSVSSVGDVIPEGERNDTLFRRACSMRGRGVEPLLIEAELMSVNSTRCKPPLGEEEIQEIVKSVIRYPISTFPLTDLGNAERFAMMHKSRVRHIFAWKKWLMYDGRRWQQDAVGEIYQLAKDTVRAMYREASDDVDDASRKECVRFARATESQSRLTAMIYCARSESGIPVRPEDLDTDKMLLNVKNGTINLRTGELQPHSSDNLITKLAPVKYDESAKCPHWNKFLMRIMNGNNSLISFLQRAIGYSLTGDISEQVLFFLYGTGANGKSTFLEVIMRLFGDYAKPTESEILMQKQHESHPTGIADLMGARLVSAMEVGEGRRMNEVKVKQITGGDTLKARFMRKDFFEFQPTHKVWLAANHKPIISGTDNAIWRRIRLIPFEVKIPENQQIPFEQLLETFQKESAGILAWAVKGCLDWQENRLRTPNEVTAAVDDYRAEMDIIGDFLNDCCFIDKNAKVQATSLYTTYEEWCDKSGEDATSKKVFGGKLTAQGYERVRKRDGWWRLGIGLLNARDPSETSRSQHEKHSDSMVLNDNQRGVCDPCDPKSDITPMKSSSRGLIGENGSQRVTFSVNTPGGANNHDASSDLGRVQKEDANGSHHAKFLSKWGAEYGCNLTHANTICDLALGLGMFEGEVGREAKLQACITLLKELVVSGVLSEAGGLYQLQR